MFGSIWSHHLKIVGAVTGGGQSDNGGWNPGTEGDPIYDDKCDAQEKSQSGGLKITTGDTQVKTETAELQIFLKDKSKINDLDIGMQGMLTRGSREDRIKITNIRLIDGMIEANTI